MVVTIIKYANVLGRVNGDICITKQQTKNLE